MTTHNGIHHLAVATGDIKTQIDFFNDVLGCELVALYWMHGVEGRLARLPEAERHLLDRVRPDTRHRRHRAHHRRHPRRQRRRAVRRRRRCSTSRSTSTRSTTCSPCATASARVASPCSARSTTACATRSTSPDPRTSASRSPPRPTPIDGRAWIDPEVVELAGITADELARYRNPEAFEAIGHPGAAAGVRSRPSVAARHPAGDLRGDSSRTPDEVVTATMSENTPPVLVDD